MHRATQGDESKHLRSEMKDQESVATSLAIVVVIKCKTQMIGNEETHEGIDRGNKNAHTEEKTV